LLSPSPGFAAVVAAAVGAAVVVVVVVGAAAVGALTVVVGGGDTVDMIIMSELCIYIISQNKFVPAPISHTQSALPLTYG